jgi:2-methylcitrate dehydratase PrpD
MAGETKTLAEFATALRYEDIPAPAVAIAKACIIDTVGVVLFGSTLPWSKIVADYVHHTGNGASTVLGSAFRRASAPGAAFANGAFAHSFEFDNLRQPSTGVHPGATVLTGALATAEEANVSGKDLITAFVAGVECMFRIAAAAKSTSEKLGFHAPGFTGVFGSAIAASRIMELSTAQTTMAMGIGGSFCSGLMAFVKSGQGGMVKRIHMGRAAEGGVTAAMLAARGFEGPEVILEGKFGALDVFARDADLSVIPVGLGERWETLTITFKTFPCHVTAQSPVQALLALRAKQPFATDEVAAITVEVADKVLSHHADPAPRDVATAQYSLPFTIALALHRDPGDPQTFLDGPNQDPAILDLAKRVTLEPYAKDGANEDQMACRLFITLKDGRTLSIARTDFEGTATSPLTRERLEQKFLKTSSSVIGEQQRTELLARLNHLEDVKVAELFKLYPSPCGASAARLEGRRPGPCILRGSRVARAPQDDGKKVQ